MSPKKFLFITHLTPKAKRSALREGLLELMDESLKAQTYTEWKALRIGEEERTEGPIQTVDAASAESLRAVYLRPDVKALIDWADYIVKLDDDDIILQHTLEIASNLEFDLYADRFHTFHDLTTGRTTQQQRPWIAATCIHKKEHAITLNRGEGVADNFINSLFYGEHGRDWIAYYAKRNIIFAQPTTPVYVRVLSPSSKSSGAIAFPAHSLADIDLQAYAAYVRGFGSWNRYPIRNFSHYLPKLQKIWCAFSQRGLEGVPRASVMLRVKELVRYIIHRLKNT
jgi:hypothetical protein